MMAGLERDWRWWAGLAIFGLLVRVGLASIYGPISYGDTPTYFRLATVLVDSGLDAYDATRVPGYPLFIAALDRSQFAVMVAQLALGVVTSLLLFELGRSLTGSSRLGGLLAVLYTLIPAQLFFEFNLLSESLTTFLVVLTLWAAHRLMGSQAAGSNLVWAFLVGFFGSLAALTRTLFFVLPPLVVLAMLLWRRRDRLKWRPALAASLAPVLLLGGWIGFVYNHYGMLSPTTMGGYHLVQHTGAFFDYLPDEEAAIRDTYIRFRDEQIAARGTQTNAIWDAIPELSERTGLSFFGLSAKLQQLSIDLIRQQPLRYLRSAVEGWVNFWKAPAYWQPDRLPAVARSPMRAGVVAGRVVSLLANGLFLAGVAATVIWPRFRQRLALDGFVIMTGILVLLASVVQTLVDHGDNPRFLIPLQMVVILLVMAGMNRLWSGPDGG